MTNLRLFALSRAVLLFYGALVTTLPIFTFIGLRIFGFNPRFNIGGIPIKYRELSGAGKRTGGNSPSNCPN
jgi:hypothetical protein